MKKKITTYAPHIRDFFEQNQKKIKAYSMSGKDYTELPDNVQDTIACNNIANQEFNYTYDNDDCT